MAKKAKLRISGRLLRKKTRRGGFKAPKRCRFSSGETPVSAIDYKNINFLRSFLTERGKILPSRISGNCAKYQRLVANEIKKARTMALMPYLSARD
jgi:small subunit ribosomal protein S18